MCHFMVVTYSVNCVVKLIIEARSRIQYDHMHTYIDLAVAIDLYVYDFNCCVVDNIYNYYIIKAFIADEKKMCDIKY